MWHKFHLLCVLSCPGRVGTGTSPVQSRHERTCGAIGTNFLFSPPLHGAAPSASRHPPAALKVCGRGQRKGEKRERDGKIWRHHLSRQVLIRDSLPSSLLPWSWGGFVRRSVGLLGYNYYCRYYYAHRGEKRKEEILGEGAKKKSFFALFSLSSGKCVVGKISEDFFWSFGLGGALLRNFAALNVCTVLL